MKILKTAFVKQKLPDACNNARIINAYLSVTEFAGIIFYNIIPAKTNQSSFV